MKNLMVSPVAKKVLGYASIVVTGVFAAVNTLTEQKKAQEFEDLKNVVSELQKKMGES